MPVTNVFEALTPDVVINSVEEAIAKRMTGMMLQLPSYINRVYELQAMDGERLIAKFYRPGRWEMAAISAEHDFIHDCAQAEIPVVVPRTLSTGTTLIDVHNLILAVFPKRGGRDFEINNDEDWRRVGQVIGRIHSVGARRKTSARLTLHPAITTSKDIEYMLNGGFVHAEYRAAFQDICNRILEVITAQFQGVELIRIHGDCHRGNLIERPGEGIMVIDFDDMVMGPCVHDLWLMLPDHFNRSRREMLLILEGYEDFYDFDRLTLRLIEGLRFMRIIYYLAWCARQSADYDFSRNHPDWGSEIFWQREIGDLSHQFQVIMEHKHQWEMEHG